ACARIGAPRNPFGVPNARWLTPAAPTPSPYRGPASRFALAVGSWPLSRRRVSLGRARRLLMANFGSRHCSGPVVGGLRGFPWGLVLLLWMRLRRLGGLLFAGRFGGLGGSASWRGVGRWHATFADWQGRIGRGDEHEGFHLSGAGHFRNLGISPY